MNMNGDDIAPLASDRSLVVQSPEEVKDFNKIGQEATQGGLRRPDNWPKIMAWPPVKLRKAIKEGRITSDNVWKMQEYVQKYADLAQKRGNDIFQHLAVSSNALNQTSRQKRIIQAALASGNNAALHWAFLMDPTGEYGQNFRSVVERWDSQSMKFIDGGEINSSPTTIKLKKGTPQSVLMLIEEARARGWGSLNISGNQNFVRLVMAEAQKHDIVVKATIKSGPFGILRSHVSNVNVLDVNNEDARLLHDLTQSLSATPELEEKKKPEVMVGDRNMSSVPFG